MPWYRHLFKNNNDYYNQLSIKTVILVVMIPKIVIIIFVSMEIVILIVMITMIVTVIC